MWFTNYFTCAAPCSPSRATIQTGLHVMQHGVRTNVAYTATSGKGGLSTDLKTLGHRFQEAGYRTPYFGKWHLNSKTRLEKLGNGLGSFGYEEWALPDHVDSSPQGEKDPIICTKAKDWLTSHGAEGPWFLTCSLINPHDIMFCPDQCSSYYNQPQLVSQLPSNFHDALEDKPGIQKEFQDYRARTCGLGPDSSPEDWLAYMNAYIYCAKAVDKQVNSLLTTLDSLGLADNTLVAFTSDHGEMGGSHQLTGKGCFMYQEAFKVPLALRWPAQLASGSQVSGLAHSVDLYPTLLDLAGLSLPSGISGRSLKNAVSGSGATGNSYVLMAYGQMDVDDCANPGRMRAIFNGRYKYGLYYEENKDDQHELYDIASDPEELNNLAPDAAYAAELSNMQALLSKARRTDMGESV